MESPTQPPRARKVRTRSLPETLVALARRGPLHIALILIGIIWLVPSLGLTVTSFRSRADISQLGWWTVFRGDRLVSGEDVQITVVEQGESSENTVVVGNTLTVSAQDSELLTEAIGGVPAPGVREFRIQQITGDLLVDELDQPITLDGVGTVVVHEDGSFDFVPHRDFTGAFIMDVETTQTPFSAEFQLQGFEFIQGELVIEAIGEPKRVPRAGEITVNADGSYAFEPRSSFHGTFETTIDASAVENPPFTIEYELKRAGAALITSEVGTTTDLPLAGSLVVDVDGSYEFVAASDFSGKIDVEVGVQNALLTLDNYSNVFNRPELPDPGFLIFFRNSFIITIPSTIFPIALAALAAFAFAWLKLPFRNVFYLMTIAMLIVPLQTTWVPILRLLNQVDLIGTWPGIWIAHTAYGTPFAIFLLYNFFKDLPGELFEAARVDGASDFGIFFRIVVPLSLPAMASLAIFQFVWVWNDLMNALIFLADPAKFPLTVGVRQLVGQYANEWDILASGAFITMLVPLIVFFGLQRYFVRGVTAGAVKG